MNLKKRVQFKGRTYTVTAQSRQMAEVERLKSVNAALLAALKEAIDDLEEAGNPFPARRERFITLIAQAEGRP